MRARYFYGWNVVGATFLMALWSFGLGFYGMSVYVAALGRLHGWSAAALSAPITLYYIAGAILTASIGDIYERWGPRVVVAGGTAAMAVGVVLLGAVTRPWQLYPVFMVMAIGWGSMSGAAINIILAPWFQRRRGLAISIAFNGATLGGVVVAPLVLVLIGAIGFSRALAASSLALLAVLLPTALAVMRRRPAELGLGPDGEPGTPAPVAPKVNGERAWRGAALRSWRFWSVSAPFALGLVAQVGMLTHLVALVTPILGSSGAARAVSMTTTAGLIGRLATGFVVDRLNRRLVSSFTLAVQILGVGMVGWAPSVAGVYAGCVLFGFGVGNLTTLPGLIIAVEWPREHFSRLVGLAVGINQFTFAFGPSLVGVVRDWAGDYGPALAVCMALQAIAAIVVVFGPGRALSLDEVALAKH